MSSKTRKKSPKQLKKLQTAQLKNFKHTKKINWL